VKVLQTLRSHVWVCVLAAVVSLCCNPSSVSARGENGRKNSPVAGGCPDLIDLIKQLTPAVVNISIERHVVPSSSPAGSRVFRLNQRYLDERVRPGDRLQNDSLGSGFFCDTAGHIVTNAHVVEGASKISVTLASGKVLTAKVVVVHPKVDLALLKINPPYQLQKAHIGDSSNIEVGQWVVAVGNPFGLGNTVTVGIVSGKGRFLGLGPDDNFIQTDASINPGNSGGPLFNMTGEVIGVNTAIIASGKGIGFAIPSNYLNELVTLAKDSDRGPVRGWVGIYVEDVNEQKAKQLGLSVPRGTVVDEVLGSAPAFQAGLTKGDLILDVDGTAVRDGRHLSRIVATARPGDVLKMKVLRGSKTQTVDVVIGKSPE
jgi:serine protease Do